MRILSLTEAIALVEKKYLIDQHNGTAPTTPFVAAAAEYPEACQRQPALMAVAAAIYAMKLAVVDGAAIDTTATTAAQEALDINDVL
jgi:hypothetical protein